MGDNNTQTIYNIQQSSYEYGKMGNRIKLYFEDIDDLKKKLKELNEMPEINIEV